MRLLDIEAPRQRLLAKGWLLYGNSHKEIPIRRLLRGVLHGASYMEGHKMMLLFGGSCMEALNGRILKGALRWRLVYKGTLTEALMWKLFEGGLYTETFISRLLY